MNNLDARVRYTRMIIQKSFLALLEQKPMGKITVTELCEKAQINRATFYKHYCDIPQLLESMEEELFQRIRDGFDDRAVDIQNFLTEMMSFSLKEKEMFWVLGSDHGDPNLMVKTFQLCYQQAYPLMTQNLPGLDETRRQMLYHFVSQGSSGVLTAWIRTGMTESPEAVAAFIMRLCTAAVKEACGD